MNTGCSHHQQSFPFCASNQAQTTCRNLESNRRFGRMLRKNDSVDLPFSPMSCENRASWSAIFHGNDIVFVVEQRTRLKHK